MIILLQLFLFFIVLSNNVIYSQENFNCIAPSIKEFSAEFYRLTIAVHNENNIVCSPLTVYLSLAMMSFATGGRSRAQILSAMNLSDDNGRNNARGFRHLVNTLSLPMGAELIAANKLFVNSKIKVDIRFQRILSFFFHTDYNTMNCDDPTTAADEINNWCDRQTHHRINNIVTADDIEKALIIWINAVDFKGQWKTPFSTKLSEFHVNDHKDVNVLMLEKSDNFTVRIHDELDAKSIELKYGKASTDLFSMFIIRPNNFDGLDKIEQNLDKLDLSQNGHKLYFKLQLPKFDIKSDLNVVPIMEKMGVVDIFDKNLSNFTEFNASEPLELRKFSQNAAIKVDEYGTDATALNKFARMSRNFWSPRVFLVNRPFFYAIAMRETGVPIFYGRVTNPRN